MEARLKEIIRTIVKEIQSEKELEEMTGTGAVAGYDTPAAFSKPGQTKKKNNRLANITGGEVVNDLEEAKDWLKKDVPADSKKPLEIKPTATDCSDSGEIADKSGMILAKDDEEASLNEKKYPSFADPLEGFPTEYKELLKKLQRSNDSDERTQLINKMNVIRKNIKLKPLTNESINENRWLAIKNEDGSPKAKMSKGITSIKQQLGEVEKFVNWYSKIKNENGVKRDDYYKRTNKSLHKIKERLMNLSEKIRTL